MTDEERKEPVMLSRDDLYRGYWAKKAADKPVVQYRLPEPETDTPLQVTISPAPPPPEAALAQTELQKQIAIARVQNSAVAVPGQLAQPHKIIAGWLTEHKRKAQEARYYGTNATSDLNRGSLHFPQGLKS